MTQIQHQSNDGRRAKRRPSSLFVLILAGAVLIGAVLGWLQHSQSDAIPLAAQDGGGGGDVLAIEGTDIQPSSPRARLDAVPVSRDALSDWLAASLGNIQREADPSAQDELMTALVTNLSFAEIRSVLARLQNSSNAMAGELSARLARRWAETDPKAASAWAVTLADGTFRGAVMDQAFIAWAEVNWTEAADWARQLPDAADRNRALRVIAGEVVRTEPMEALRLATELAPGAQRNELVRHAAMEWAGQDATAAAQWAQGISDPALRSQVLASVAMTWADQDIQTAATLAVNGLPSGRVQADAVVGIVTRWVQVEPEAAAAWVGQFPAGNLRQDAIESLVAIWSLSDAPRAHEWQNQLAGVGSL